MRRSTVHFEWLRTSVRTQYRTGVSLHGHTLHSRETLDYLVTAAHQVPGLSGAIRKQEQRYHQAHGHELDFQQAWWTPPLAPADAWRLEHAQIANLGLRSLVSLTDHDNIDAALSPAVLEQLPEFPVSVEWTVPFRNTFFHLGIHNMPLSDAPARMRRMQQFTQNPREPELAPLLDWLSASPDTLMVLNHPLWDESHCGAGLHRDRLNQFLGAFGPFFHALELNGLRHARENRAVMALAETVDLPVISGGDRHSREPNACINLTNAATFPEFIEQVRRDGLSTVMFLPHYRVPMRLRLVQNVCDVLSEDSTHALGWTRWSDRVFYRNPQGTVRSLTDIWGHRAPSLVSHFIFATSLLAGKSQSSYTCAS